MHRVHLVLILLLSIPFVVMPITLAAQPVYTQKSTIREKGVIRSRSPSLRVFYVHLFNGEFPIPITYELFPVAQATGDHLEFRSPSIPLIGTRKGMSVNIIGSITIGSYSRYLERHGNPYKKGSTAWAMECYGLAVVARKEAVPKSEHLDFNYAFIHDADQYVEIGSVHEELWKRLLVIFGNVSHRKPGRNCTINKF